jgi:hypothetical protein
MTPVLVLCLCVLLAVIYGTAHFFGFPGLLGLLAFWIAVIVWRNKKSNAGDEP